MALAMTPTAAVPTHDDTMDIDIDMDVGDMDPVGEDEMLEEGEEPELIPAANQVAAGEVPAIYLEDPSQEPQWEKVHLRGVDDLSTDNIRRFASDYFADADPYVQWIDDTSANLVYKDKTMARKAILNFVMHDVPEAEIQNNPFELRTAKPLVTNPASILTVRMAMMGDRKKKNARDASRYYLMHPEVDPGERARRGEYGDYKRRRFDEREHKRRQRHQDDNPDAMNDFEASMYDDAPAEKTERNDRGRDLFSRVTRPRHRSASPVANGGTISMSDSETDSRARRRRNGYRSRDSPPPRHRNAGRELFASSTDDGSGMRSDHLDLASRITKPISQKDRTMTTSYETNQGVARQLKADLRAAQNQSPVRSHRRSRAIDSRVEEDLAERFGRKSISLDSTKSVRETTANSGKELFAEDRNVNLNDGGFSIKGSATQGMSIKGRAGDVKELFPDRFSSGGRGVNAGKELFDQPIRNRVSRQRAGDLFD